MPGSLDRVQRTEPAPAPPGIRELLSSEPRSLGVGKRYSGAATHPAAGVWPDRLDTSVGRPASPIRTARCVNLALPMMILSPQGASVPIRRQSRAPHLVITGSTYVYRAEPPTNGSRIGRETAG